MRWISWSTGRLVEQEIVALARRHGGRCPGCRRPPYGGYGRCSGSPSSDRNAIASPAPTIQHGGDLARPAATTQQSERHRPTKPASASSAMIGDLAPTACRPGRGGHRAAARHADRSSPAEELEAVAQQNHPCCRSQSSVAISRLCPRDHAGFRPAHVVAASSTRLSTVRGCARESIKA